MSHTHEMALSLKPFALLIDIIGYAALVTNKDGERLASAEKEGWTGGTSSLL